MKKFSSVCFASASNTGFTIIEVLIALAIFSIGLMAISALQTASLMSARASSEKTEAWAFLDHQAEILKSLPFYANRNLIDDDGDGVVDELTETMPELVGSITGVTHSLDSEDGKYTVSWEVVNNRPIYFNTSTNQYEPVQVPPKPILHYPVLSGIPAGNYVISKTIRIWVTLQGLPEANALASASFVRSWAEDGILVGP